MVNTRMDDLPREPPLASSVDSEVPPSPPVTTPLGEEAKELMTAIVLNSFGTLKNVKVAKRTMPSSPLEKQVNVKVILSGINFQDVMTRLGVMDSIPTPFVMGSEFVGRVIGVGEGVTSVKEDDLVFGLPDFGAWAEQVTIPEHLIWKIPDGNIPLEKLACTLPYLVANLLLGDATPSPSTTILVHSAGGSVGLAIRDLAKDSKVIGITSKTKVEKLQGFTQLIERGSDYVAEIRKTYPSGVDIVLDCQGGEDCARGISLLAPGGRYILFGAANIVSGESKSFFAVAKCWWQVEKVSPLKLYEENKTVGGLHLRHFLRDADKKDFIGQKLNKIWDLMASGQIQPTIDSTLNFREVTEGMSKLHERKNIGKILLNFQEPKVDAENSASQPPPPPQA